MGKSDPYVVLSVSNSTQTMATTIKENNLNPEWNEDLLLNLPSLSEELMIQVLDSDAKGDKTTEEGRKKDDFLGLANVKLDDATLGDLSSGGAAVCTKRIRRSTCRHEQPPLAAQVAASTGYS